MSQQLSALFDWLQFLSSAASRPSSHNSFRQFASARMMMKNLLSILCEVKRERKKEREGTLLKRDYCDASIPSVISKSL